jgi:hypothetical protein
MSYFYANNNNYETSGHGSYLHNQLKMTPKPPSITAPTNPKLPPQAPAPVAQLSLDSASNLSFNNNNIKSTPPNSIHGSTTALATTSATPMYSQINYVTYNLDDLKLNNIPTNPNNSNNNTGTFSQQQPLSKNMSSANLYNNYNNNNNNNNNSNNANRFPLYPQAKKSKRFTHSRRIFCLNSKTVHFFVRFLY